MVTVKRLPGNPIITPTLDARIGTNINGPSLIRVPDWLPNPLGKYYLYFGHHQGQFIRLAYADALSGPWTVYAPGVLNLTDTPMQSHIASPDVHVDNEAKQIRLYYHGVTPQIYTGRFEGQSQGVDFRQRTAVALSQDGLHFEGLPDIFATSYLRAWRWQDMWYALSMPGLFFRSADGLTNWEEGPVLFDRDMRHAALQRDGCILSVYYSQVGDTPEHIIMRRIELSDDWLAWQEGPREDVLLPKEPWEGADLPLEPSVRGWASQRVNQLRDPAIYREDNKFYLIYSVAGEAALAIGEIKTGIV